MRRLSTVAAAAPTRSSSRLSLGRLFQQQPIGTIGAQEHFGRANLVAKIPEQPKPHRLNENDAYVGGLRRTEAGVYLQKQEEEAFQGCNKIGPMEDEELSSPKADAFVEAVKVKLSRHMCTQAAASFELLDQDKDGKVHLDEVEKLLQVAAHGNGIEWLKSQFHLYDVDGNDVVNEAESKLILDSMIATQKAVMTEIFATHVDNLPKKREKLFAKSLSEEDFKSKIPEKVRCVFHFANKLDEERKMYDWELFENSQSWLSSQKVEFPELHNLLAVYAKGFYDERFTFYERKQEKRSTRYKGLLLAAAIGLGDYIAAVI
ncbi:EF-hand domain pair [Phytophthora cactorum]|nr:EF-hand domain pair [Phytophthora cactorum]